MPIFSRDEGTPARDPGALRLMMPFLMRGRNESAVYYTQRLDVGPTLAWIEAQRAEGREVSFFEVVLAAFVRTLALRPKMNRFVSGRRLYDRRGISLAFAVKKRMEDDAGLSTVKVFFEPADTLADVAGRVREAVHGGRSDAKSTSEKEMAVVTRLPGPMIALLMWAQRLLDGWNLLPAAMIRADPLYSSLFCANLGSIGLQAPFHHLYEYGTVPLFAVIGAIHKAAWVDEDGETSIRDVVEIKWTFDERIADGFYCVRGIQLIGELLADPSSLDTPP